MKRILALLLVLLSLTACALPAQNADPERKALSKAVKEKLEASRKDLQYISHYIHGKDLSEEEETLDQVVERLDTTLDELDHEELEARYPALWPVFTLMEENFQQICELTRQTEDHALRSDVVLLRRLIKESEKLLADIYNNV